MAGGTRFRLFPQSAQGYREPEVVELAPPPGAILPGPQDAAMYVANPLDKLLPYDPPDRLPPYGGPLHPPATPGPDGHFDRIPVDAPQFLAAHLYGAARLVLDLWQGYIGHRVEWWHAATFPRLELVPLLRWGNAQSGFGFLETGMRWSARRGAVLPFCLNFDVVAHEVGHAILFSTVGAPAPGRLTGAYLAVHEAFSDLIAAVSALHFRSVAERLLRQTRGNLYALNLISRLAEYSDVEQVRVLDNTVRLSDLEGVRLGPDAQWIDPLGLTRRQHMVAAPLTGAIWDCFVEVFQDGLVARGAIGPDLDARGWTREEVEASLEPLQRGSEAALARFGPVFAEALREARDLIGGALARCIGRLDADDLSFGLVAARFLEALVELGQAGNLPAFEENFRWREIDPRPRAARLATAPPVALVGPPGPGAMWPPPFGGGCQGCRNPFAVLAAGRLIEHPDRGTASSAGG